MCESSSDEPQSAWLDDTISCCRAMLPLAPTSRTRFTRLRTTSVDGVREERDRPATISSRSKAWRPQITRLWRGIGKACGWKHTRAPSAK